MATIPGIKHYVLRLDVSVYDATNMDVVQSGAYARQEKCNLIFIKSLVSLQIVSQILTYGCGGRSE